MRLLDTEFAEFFYRTAHTYYFDMESLSNACSYAGLNTLNQHFAHSFGVGNMMGWLKDKQPCGDGIILSEEQVVTIDYMWKSWMEVLGATDTIYLILKNEGVH